MDVYWSLAEEAESGHGGSRQNILTLGCLGGGVISPVTPEGVGVHINTVIYTRPRTHALSKAHAHVGTC
jgi:hypothetical protein